MRWYASQMSWPAGRCTSASAGESRCRTTAVVGFGDSDVSRVCQPPLTTMAVPHRKIGIEAGKALLERLNDGDWRDQKPIASSLCLRESC